MGLKYRLQAWDELLGRYRAIFGFWWGRRRDLTPPNLRAVEAEFLPAALAIQHEPVSPAGRLVARMLIGLLTVILLWSIFGRVDITVNAHGKIIPDGRSKIITAVQVADVRAILVANGERVKAGQTLIELDSRAIADERLKYLSDWQSAALQVARSRALIAAVNSGDRPRMPPVPGVNTARWDVAAAHLQGQWADFVAKRDQLDADIARYQSALPLVRRIARAYTFLATTNDVARTDALAKEQAQVDLQGKLAAALAQRAVLSSETRKRAERDLAQATKAAADAKADAAQAKTEANQFILRSPVDGTVQQLQVHTVDAAVPAAQPLLKIVPHDSKVEMEAMVADKDVGFVHVGQHAEVKIDAFNYTKYGTIPATVSFVSPDAMMKGKKKGLQYAVRVTLLRRTLDVDGIERALTPGMSGTVDIRTGRRRIIEFFLSPLIRHVVGSLHER
jgi:hemolysin D